MVRGAARSPRRVRSGPTLLTGALLAVLLAGPGLATAQAATASTPGPAAGPVPLAAGPAVPPLPGPRPLAPLPAGLENAASYVPADSCDPTVKPGVSRLAALLESFYPGTGSLGIVHTCAAEASVSEHTEGRAFDWAASVANPTQRAQVSSFLAWALAPDAAGRPAANARRLGIMYLIWDKRIFGLYALGSGWRPYACVGVTGCHQDHVHISLTWAGAEGLTSFWTGTVASDDYGPCRGLGQMFAPPRVQRGERPCPGWAPATATSPVVTAIRAAHTQDLSAGSSGSAVRALQLALGGPTPDGRFGDATLDLVRTFQERRGLPVTGAVDADLWANLLDYVTAGQVPMMVAAPTPAPVTVPAAATAPASRPRVPPTRVAAAPTSPLSRYRNTVLAGAPGPAVSALQRVLQLPVTGRYDACTVAAVRAFQRSHHLVPDGVVGPLSWAALGG